MGLRASSSVLAFRASISARVIRLVVPTSSINSEASVTDTEKFGVVWAAAVNGGSVRATASIRRIDAMGETRIDLIIGVPSFPNANRFGRYGDMSHR